MHPSSMHSLCISNRELKLPLPGGVGDDYTCGGISNRELKRRFRRFRAGVLVTESISNRELKQWGRELVESHGVKVASQIEN